MPTFQAVRDYKRKAEKESGEKHEVNRASQSSAKGGCKYRPLTSASLKPAAIYRFCKCFGTCDFKKFHTHLRPSFRKKITSARPLTLKIYALPI
eukprot:g5849.t1